MRAYAWTVFSGLESPLHLLVLLVIAALLFGPKRLPELGRSLGEGMRGFKRSLEGDEESGGGAGDALPQPGSSDRPE